MRKTDLTPEEIRFATALSRFPFCSIASGKTKVICPACEGARPWREANGLRRLGWTEQCRKSRSLDGMKHHANTVKNTPHKILADYLELIEIWGASGGGSGPNRSTRPPSGSGSGKGPGGSHSRSYHAFPSGVPLGRRLDGAGSHNTGRRGSRGKGGGARGDTEANGARCAGADATPELKAYDDHGNKTRAVRTAAANDGIDEGARSGGEIKGRKEPLPGDGRMKANSGRAAPRGDYHVELWDNICQAKKSPRVP